MSNEKGNTPVLLIAREAESPFEYLALNSHEGKLQVQLMGRQSDGTLTPVLVDADGALLTRAAP